MILVKVTQAFRSCKILTNDYMGQNIEAPGASQSRIQRMFNSIVVHCLSTHDIIRMRHDLYNAFFRPLALHLSHCKKKYRTPVNSFFNTSPND